MWVVVTRNNCQFCEDAKTLLKGKGIYYTTYNVQEKGSKWVLSLIKMAGLTTAPQIFDNEGNHIGGYTDLVEHFKGS
jgi:glutaredoxin